MIGSNLDVVKNNLEWISEQVKQGKIKKATINCVISLLNYTEIPDLVDYARKLNICISIAKYDNWGTMLADKYDKLAVWEESNEFHNDFLYYLKLNSHSYKECYLTPLFEELAKKEELKDRGNISCLDEKINEIFMSLPIINPPPKKKHILSFDIFKNLFRKNN